MSQDETVLSVDQAGAVRIITLNRPSRFNALNQQLKAELITALQSAARDTEVRCVILTGAGKAFCAGQDLQEGNLSPTEVGAALRLQYNKIAGLLYAMEKPVIAAVNGVAAGAGMSLAVLCDLRVLGETAAMRLAFSSVGLIPDCGATFTLSRLLPRGIALELAYTGRAVSAAEALALGLANRVVPDDELPTQAAAWAAALAERPTRALGLTKRALNFATGRDMESALEYEAYTQQIAAGTADFGEGVAAFREKRVARFEGK
jgi:2-(1,2-epoxy-1,2-dihydrophenyl)acetyl-CoA isomerase